MEYGKSNFRIQQHIWHYNGIFISIGHNPYIMARAMLQKMSQWHFSMKLCSSLILIFDQAKGFLQCTSKSFTSDQNHYHCNFPSQNWLLSRTTETTKITERGERKYDDNNKRGEKKDNDKTEDRGNTATTTEDRERQQQGIGERDNNKREERERQQQGRGKTMTTMIDRREERWQQQWDRGERKTITIERREERQWQQQDTSKQVQREVYMGSCT